MLKYIFLLFLNLGINFAFGQEFVYIDSEYILKNIPEYLQAKEKLDGLATKWTKEVEDRTAAIKIKKGNFSILILHLVDLLISYYSSLYNFLVCLK